MELQDKRIEALHSRFGEELAVISPQGERFPLTGENAVFILSGESDLFFSGKTAEGNPGFSLSLFSGITDGALIPPMPVCGEVNYYGRCLPDAQIIYLPWRKILDRLAAGDDFLWNCVRSFFSCAKFPTLPENVDALNAMLTEKSEACVHKLSCVEAMTQNLISNNAREQERQGHHILASFAKLFQVRGKTSAVCDPADPAAAAAAFAAAQCDISHFILSKGNSIEQRIERSSEANQVRITPAVLDGLWYKESFLPMLVFALDGKNAYCVFRNRHNDPVAWCGATGNLYVIDAAFCRTVQPSGWSFILPFPESPVTESKLVSFFFRIFQKKLPAILLLILAVTVMDMFVPVINSMIFADVIPNSDRTLLGQLFFLLLVASFARVLMDHSCRMLIRSARETAERSIQMALFDRVLKLPVDFFRHFSPGELAMRALGGMTLFSLFNTSLILSLLNIGFLVIPVAMLFYYSVKLAAITLTVLLLVLAVVFVVSLFISKYQFRIISRQGEIDGILERFLANIGKLHAAGAEKHALSVWVKNFSEKQILTVKTGRCMLLVRVILASANWLLFVAMMAIVLWIYQNEKTDDMISTSDFSGFISTVSILSGALFGMLGNIDTVLRFGPFFKWIGPLLTTPVEEQGTVAGEGEETELRGGVELDNVSFAYDGERQILKDVSIKAAPGEFIAITGESGAGKSTLLRLMLCFEKPTSGTVLYDGEDVKTKNMRHIRSRIGVVLQNADLTPDSILHNITGTTSCYTEKDAWEAAEMAGCAEDIRKFPMQMQTVLTGSTISGGQQQRILLAHAMIRRPKLIFLDEATSALDNGTQKIVIDSLRKISATKVVIAHRLSTIMDADRIYVLDHGSVAEVGTFSELMKKNGIFAKMAARQVIDQQGE